MRVKEREILPSEHPLTGPQRNAGRRAALLTGPYQGPKHRKGH